MATWFIIIIYMAFISLGLPDSLLGSAWPVMCSDIGASFGTAGVISMTIAGGTIVSSLFSGKIIKFLGTGKITLISCCMTAGALLGFSAASSMIWLVILSVPLGLGAGAVDSALNHYVAENYKAHHMNWLHCFWGVGATAGPLIMSYFIAKNNSWRGGYGAVSIIQFILVFVLFITLPLWKRIAEQRKQERLHNENPIEKIEIGESGKGSKNKGNILRINGVKPTLIAFLFYCGAESTVGLWGASYLVGAKNINAETAAGWISLYYGGITVGRLLTGFVSFKVPNRILIRCGQLIAISGGVLLLLPLHGLLTLFGFILIGFGFAPIFPGLLHETPTRFGSENSAKLMGFQMAVAYTGSTFLSPLLGVLATITSIHIFPFIVFAYLILIWLCSERVNSILSKQ